MKTFQKPLTAGEEAYYLKQLRGEDKDAAREAKDILIERNLRLVAHIVKKYQNVDEEMDDLISIGCIGLIKAVDSFDERKGRLVTYACRCIDNELLMMLRSKKKKSKEVSLYEPIGQDKEGNEIHLVDIIEQQQYDVVEDMERRSNLKRLVEYMNDILTPRERQILIMRYGLGGKKELTQNDVGELFGISRSYVSRIEKKTLRKLKDRFEQEK
ncbi:MAG: RNA polymerase sporulation sigma factor SigK [Lachnospiraceae bacterium]|nr:RNA polymerase sporulation sigma factor SigK [Lachnospiraceae bacterium]